MKRKFSIIAIVMLLLSVSSCKNNTPDEPKDNDQNSTDTGDIIGVTTGGSYGTDEPNATTFSFTASRLDLPSEDYEYLEIGTYGTNNFFQMGGDIRIRLNDAGNKVKGIELEKNTLGWIKFTVDEECKVVFNVASTSSSNTSKVVLVNAETTNKQTLESDYSDVVFNEDSTIASVSGTSYCKISANISKGSYILRSPAISDKTDPAYRRNLMLLSISIGDDIPEEESYFLTADTLKTGTYTETIKLFSGKWGSINLTANTAKHVMIDSNNKTYEEHSFGTRIKTCGKMEDGVRAMIIKLNKKYEITMYAMSSSKSESRIVNIYNSDLSSTAYTFDNVLGTSLLTYTFTLDTGTYYLTTTTGGLNIYAFNLAEK